MGQVAQQRERSHYMREVGGSSPSLPTKKMNYSRKEIIEKLGASGGGKRLERDLQILLTRAKQAGLLKIPNQQKLEVKDADFVKIIKVVEFIKWINEYETPNLRSFEETKKLIDSLFESLNENTTINVVALLCPSYIKGRSAVGFNNTIGESTKRGINNVNAVSKKLSHLGFKIKTRIIFGDLVLENYDEMAKKNLLIDIKKNIESAKKFSQSLNPSFEFKRLSDYHDASAELPPRGIEGIPTRVERAVYELTLQRNGVFYKEQFGWTPEKVLKRTNILACSYPVLGDFFRKNFEKILFVYTANSFERGRMYQGEFAKSNPIPIFFPLKKP